jgi:asparagine synthase (glutamine-hydrolysing)
MCGFAGILSFDAPIPVDLLRRMSACIAHRGPDGEGIHLDGHIGLAHRRLAIIDPDPRANQPFTDGRAWIAYNGEIYNFRELRNQLASLNPQDQWKTECDTEVLLRAYAQWGADCLTRLDGMFAFAIWDPAGRSLFLARDRTGQKPLYYARRTNGSFAFASELPALLAAGQVDTGIDEQSLADYLRYGYVPAGRSIYRGIRQLPPGHFMTHSAEPAPYFDLNAPADPPAGDLRALVENAVRRQLISDVPLGCFLSGGVDSSIIALCMKRAVGADQPVLTFSIGFDDPRYDETAYARQVARHLGTQHHEFTVRPNAAEDLPRLAAVFGEPFADSSALPTHYLARETRNHVKVALSGDGGDELFGGYDRYRAMAIARKLQHLPEAVRSAIARSSQLIPGVHPKSRAARLKRFTATLNQPPADRFDGYVRLFDEPRLREILPSAPPPCPGNPRDWFETLSRTRDPVATAAAVDRVTYLPGDLHTKVDRAAMAHHLEVRAPFMDVDILRFATGLDANQLLGSGPKHLLRQTFAHDLPAFVFTRRKMGFAVPIGQWFRTSLREMLHDTLLSPAGFCATHLNHAAVRQLIDEHHDQRADHSQRLYALLMLELWQQWLGSCT